MPTGADVQPLGSSACVTQLCTAVMSASNQWTAYPLPVNTTFQTPVRTIMPFTWTIAPKNPQLQAMASTEMTGYVAPPRTVTLHAQTGLCVSRTFPPVIASARPDRVGVSSTIQMTKKAPVRILASQEGTPAKKITMGLDASHAADAILMPTSKSSTPQPTSVEDGLSRNSL